MRKLLKFIIGLPLLLLAACDVHEFPVAPETVNFHLRLNYETEMTEWKHSYDGTSVVEQGLGKTYDNHLANGKIRYIVRAYPAQDKLRTAQNATAEFVFTKDIAEGYDHELTLALPPGDYNIRVWSDLQQTDINIYIIQTTSQASCCRAITRATLTIAMLSEARATSRSCRTSWSVFQKHTKSPCSDRLQSLSLLQTTLLNL